MQDVVKYETKIFTTGKPDDPDVSLYAQEPSDEVDELWKGLYPSMSLPLSRFDRMKLINRPQAFFNSFPNSRRQSWSTRPVYSPMIRSGDTSSRSMFSISFIAW